MFPTLFTFSQEHGLSFGPGQLGDPDVIGIHLYGLMIMLAILAAALISSNRAARVGIDPDGLVPLYLLSCISGVLGARLYHFLFAELGLLTSNPMAFFDINEGGLAFLGGIIGGVISGGGYALWRGMPMWKLADVIAPTLMLAAAVGRVGCFFSGCCHGGAVSDVTVTSTVLSLAGGSVVLLDGAPFISMVFNPGIGVGAIHNVPVYPTQIWEVVSGTALFGLLSLMWLRFRRFDGQILAAMLVCYAPVRIVNEMFRGDTVRGLDKFGTGLSSSQFVSLLLIVLAVVIVAYRLPRGLAPEEPVRYDDDLEDEQVLDG
jgi:phosphatidylglycerol:prolipoprotein diacylglycerol transferase